MPTDALPSTAIAALAAQIELSGGAVPDAVQLLPAGEFRAEDGRPADATAWVLDTASAQKLIAQVAARKNRMVIDYEHQTVHARANGQPAPAAGWFSALEWRDGSGLWAVGVQWTDRARQMIASGEYRYISPVFAYDRKTGAISRILHAALTNDPALDGMAAVAASSQLPTDIDPETSMELKDLVAACAAALGAQALEADKLAPAIAALKAEADTAKAALTSAEASLKTEREATAALKASTQPMEVVAALRADLAALTADLTARKIDDLVKPALADGRLLPTQEAWARELGASNVAALTAYLQTAQPIAALTGTQTGGKAQAKPGAKADDADGIAQAALAYQADQARSGVQVSTQAAVAHVIKAQGKAA